jgi:Fe-S-cluster containining protein
MNEPWYRDGLQFTCTRCGKCCTGKPGVVWVDPSEIDRIAALLGITQDEMIARFTRPIDHRRSLTERRDGACTFFEAGRGCTIYSERPRQCRTWPFWDSNLSTPADWDRTMDECPGAGQGEHHDAAEVTRRRLVIRV